MKIVYGRQLDNTETLAAKAAAKTFGISFDTARLLFCRGYDTEEKIRKFLSPGKKEFNDPFLLSGMKEGVERVTRARDNGERVLVFGDYDADGICATAILYSALKKFGVNADKVIPERENGYGLNLSLVEEKEKSGKIDLLITVDCGISDGDKIKELISRGTDVIVTDHHEPPEVLPECIKINPKLTGQDYPFNGLCGAGVAYKLSRALLGERADEYLDLAALATVADSMELVEENRSVVAEGLKLINSSHPREAIKSLLGKATSVTAQTLAFQVAPRLNAGGRMGDADTALTAFTSDDKNVIFDCCSRLAAYNIQRQAECDEIYREAKEMIKRENSCFDPVILVASEKWRTGFIGIVAARIAEEFSRPVIVFAGADCGYKGSARSVASVNIFDALTEVKDLLVEFGGHAQAAGVAVTKENYEPLRRALCKYVKDNDLLAGVERSIYAEWNIEGKIDLGFARELERLEPFGVGNRRPIFTADADEAVISRPLKKGSPHYSFFIPTGEMLDFYGGGNAETLALPVKKKIAFELNYSVFNGRENAKGFVKGVFPDYGNSEALLPYVIKNELRKVKERAEYKAEKFSAKPLVKGMGTLYAVSDPENLKLYGYEKDGKKGEFGGRPDVYYFRPPEKSSADCVVISLSEACGEHAEIVYLDKPLAVKDFGLPVSMNEDADGVSRYIKNMSAERQDFASAFSYLLSLNGKPFYGSAEGYGAYSPDFTAEQFVFCTEVFLELKIFRIENGRLIYDASVKNALGNSEIYNAVKARIL